MNSPVDFLARIEAEKREESARREREIPLSEIRRQAESSPPPRDFIGAIQRDIARNRPAVIAEIKRRSPSKGVLREPFDIAEIARAYAEGGASCLSVLTDSRYFGGSDSHLQTARMESGLPVLRKDFMVVPYQIAESRALGADAVLLMASLLPLKKMREMASLAAEFGMAVLAEAHTADEVQTALEISDALVGINSRNLRTLEINLTAAESLLPLIPFSRIAVAESGIQSREDAARLRKAGASVFLAGEVLMRSSNPAAALKEIFG